MNDRTKIFAKVVDELNNLLVDKSEKDNINMEDLVYFSHETNYYCNFIKFNGVIVFDSENNNWNPDEELKSDYGEYVITKTSEEKIVEQVLSVLSLQMKSYSLILRALYSKTKMKKFMRKFEDEERKT